MGTLYTCDGSGNETIAGNFLAANVLTGRSTSGSATVTTGTGTVASVTDQWMRVGDLVIVSSRIIVNTAATSVGLGFAITLTLPNTFTCVNGATGIFGSCNLFVSSTTSSLANIAAQGGSSTTIVVGGNATVGLGFGANTVTIGVVYSFNI